MPKPVKSGYLPSLDGWRAVSILIVLVSHDYPIPGLEGLQSVGHFGVYIFFAISGILMTWRMQNDEKAKGRFDIRDFYVRRLFRIQPALMLYLAVIAALTLGGVIQDRWRYWFGALLAIRNFQNVYGADAFRQMGYSWFTGHFWTLSIEEHFYILLSLFFVFVKRNRALVLGLLLVGMIRAQHWGHSHGLYDPTLSPRRSYWELQYLFFPAFLSLLATTEVGKEFCRRYCRPWLVFLLTIAVTYGAYSRHFPLRHSDVFVVMTSQQGYLCLSFGFWVLATVSQPGSLTTQILEAAPLRYLGRLSYSMYLWQQLLFLHLSGGTKFRGPLAWASRQPVHYVVVLAIAAVSYHFVEKPMIRLGHRLAPPATPGHADLSAGTSASAAMGVTA